MTEIEVYRFPETGSEIRAIVGDEEPVFIAADLAAAFGYRDTYNATRLLTEAEKGTHLMSTPGGQQQVTVVTEGGMYRLAMRSNLPGAVKFQMWIANEVLPSIRKTGAYATPVAPAMPDITTPAGVLALAEKFAETARQLVDADTRIQELEPKALAHDVFLASQDGDVLVRQAAKLLGWQEKHLRQFMVDEHLIYERQATCGARQWDFYADHRAHFNAVEATVEHGWGRCAHYTLYVTPRGLSLVQKRITKRQAEMRNAIEAGAK